MQSHRSDGLAILNLAFLVAPEEAVRIGVVAHLDFAGRHLLHLRIVDRATAERHQLETIGLPEERRPQPRRPAWTASCAMSTGRYACRLIFLPSPFSYGGLR